MTLPPIVTVPEGSRSLRAVNILRCFTGRFTIFSEPELTNSIVTRVIYGLLRILTSVLCAMSRS